MARVLKFIQVNIYKGRYFQELLEFLEAERPDVISAQEVTTGAVNFYEDKDADLFELLKKALQMEGVFHSDVEIKDEPNAAFGNAVFAKRPIIKSSVVKLKTFRPVTLSEFNNNTGNIWARLPRHMLDAVVDLGDFKLHVISVHARRIVPPADDSENLRQARLMAAYVESLGRALFILGGDFNMPPASEVIKTVCGAANNLMESSAIKQTLNPKVHELGDNGYLVDYIFTSRYFRLKSLQVPQVMVSDHLPVVVQLEFRP